MREIRRLQGVQQVDSLSMAEVVIENRALTVAAVDPDSYRHFTHSNSANTDEVWDRVAGGEVAVLRGLRDKLPLDAGGFLKMGSSADVPSVHVGAYAPQVYTAIDAVVNEKWGSELGLKSSNALLISTGHEVAAVAPQVDREDSRRRRLRAAASTRWPASASTPASSRPRS